MKLGLGLIAGFLGAALMLAAVFANPAAAGSCSCPDQSWGSLRATLLNSPREPNPIEGRIQTCAPSPTACKQICKGSASFGADRCVGYIEVSSKGGWQKSGLSVPPGKNIRIDDVIGQWTGNLKSDGFHGLSGPSDDFYSAPSSYPAPGEKENVLVLSVGSWAARVHEVGVVIGANEHGELYFAMNDKGDHDNAGSLWVKVSFVD